MISIITPVYNDKKNIKTCIVNVIEQSCPDIEHVIVDGGSTDGTLEIIESYANSYSHISYISEPDEGNYDATNKGIQLSKGKIVSILNSDDFYEPGVLQRISDIFRGLPEPSFLVGACNVLVQGDRLRNVNRPSKLEITQLLLRGVNNFPYNPSQYFYHKSLHEIIGPYDSRMGAVADVDFIFKAVQNSHTKYIDEIWGNMRFVPGTITYENHVSGEKDRALDKVYGKYIQMLSCPQRLKFYYLRFYYYVMHRTTSVFKKLLRIFKER